MAGSDDGSCNNLGCADEAACNYNPWAECDDGSCIFGQHVFIPNQESTLGSPVFVWCGPLPDCSNVTIGCPIPSGYVEIDDPCVNLILDDFAACSLAWSQTCSLQLLLCMQSVLGCTNRKPAILIQKPVTMMIPVFFQVCPVMTGTLAQQGGHWT